MLLSKLRQIFLLPRQSAEAWQYFQHSTQTNNVWLYVRFGSLADTQMPENARWQDLGLRTRP
jgi:hypothetical protein